MCVKFSRTSDSGRAYFSKTTKGVIFMGHPVKLVTKEVTNYK